MIDLSVSLGPLELRSPLIAAAGTVGSVIDFAHVGALEAYGAAVAKSVSGTPWSGNPPPRLGPAGTGMLNAIGIQNPGIDQWIADVAPEIGGLPVPVWGSAVGKSVDEFAEVARRLDGTDVDAIEVNLSCPNVAGESIWALEASSTAEVVAAVRSSTRKPIGAKLSPDAFNIVEIAAAALAAGADWLVLTNTITGAAINVDTGRPVLTRTSGGYSGPPLKPIALRCVIEVHTAFPEAAIVGCGGVRHGNDVVEYLLAGASAVAIGTAHFERPRIGRSISRQVRSYCRKHGIVRLADLEGGMRPW